MSLVDLRMPEKDIKAMNEPESKQSKIRYPLGLLITIETDTIDKLGINFDTAKIGKEYTATVVMKVMSTSANNYNNNSMSLQITKMDVHKSKFDKYYKTQNAKPGE